MYFLFAIFKENLEVKNTTNMLPSGDYYHSGIYLLLLYNNTKKLNKIRIVEFEIVVVFLKF